MSKGIGGIVAFSRSIAIPVRVLSCALKLTYKVSGNVLHILFILTFRIFFLSTVYANANANPKPND